MLTDSLRTYLQDKFDNRVTFDRTERTLYGHDIAAMPSLVKPLIGNTTPDAVVQPRNEAELIDIHPEVFAQWGVFEAFIDLMTPEGFAALMDTMWPELISAMPFGMGGMMRFMGKRTPAALEWMKPVFPALFPRLLPMMMPKVMPTMLDRVAKRVPTMPDYMAEQMPDMMPKVMDNLMPHMIDDLVPLVTDPMVDYLKNGSK